MRRGRGSVRHVACIDRPDLNQGCWAQGKGVEDFREPAMGRQEQALLLLQTRGIRKCPESGPGNMVLLPQPYTACVGDPDNVKMHMVLLQCWTAQFTLTIAWCRSIECTHFWSPLPAELYSKSRGDKRNLTCEDAVYRDLMRQKKITMEEGKEARKLLNMPGGLELHIGVSHWSPLARVVIASCHSIY